MTIEEKAKEYSGIGTRRANEIVVKMPDECRCKNLLEIVHTTLRLLKEIQERK